ncbi:MAG: RHS repeat-associated core domain-containing protein, partial [Candidatus Rokuibacteriota bacterium]
AVSASNPAFPNPLQFTGRENDGIAGLYYYRARYYHPGLQRFISEDPLGFVGGDPNLYAYVFNRPTILRDPSGLDVYFLGLQASAFLGGIGQGQDRGVGKEVTLGIAFDATTLSFRPFKSVGRARPSNPEDHVVGANAGLGPVIGVLQGDFADFFGEAREETLSLSVGPGASLTFIETPTGKSGVSFGMSLGPPFASATTITTHTSPLCMSGRKCEQKRR